MLPVGRSAEREVKVDGRHYRSIWCAGEGQAVEVIDQPRLPHLFEVRALESLEDAAQAIESMVVRGAPLIGAAAAYGVALAMREATSDEALERACRRLLSTRPTAANLRWALEEMLAALRNRHRDERVEAAYRRAAQLCDEDVELNAAIGRHGLAILQDLASDKPPGQPLNVLTHCNAGWLATVDWGTATAPLYLAHDLGLDLHVWVDETRPRNQGALTAWELGHHGVAHTVIADNTGGHLMQHGLVDVVITGSDRTTGTGDVANKIGTYLKALAARDNAIPFYVALPSPTIDFSLGDGLSGIPIEQRDPAEVSGVTGRTENGDIARVEVFAPGSAVANYAFDVTPGRLVTGLITEAGVAPASPEGLAALFPQRARAATQQR